MKCKKCRREIADNSIFCSWCGYKQLTAATETRVPTPTHRGNLWSSQIMLDGERVYVTAESEAEYYAKARAVKDKLVKIKKAAPRLTLGTAIDNYIKVNDSVLSPSTINAYKSYRKTRFKAFMDLDVGQINYQQMVNEEARNYAPKTVHTHGGSSQPLSVTPMSPCHLSISRKSLKRNAHFSTISKSRFYLTSVKGNHTNLESFWPCMVLGGQKYCILLLTISTSAKDLSMCVVLLLWGLRTASSTRKQTRTEHQPVMSTSLYPNSRTQLRV